MRHYQHAQTRTMAEALRRLADQLDAHRPLDLIAPTVLHVSFGVTSVGDPAPEHVRRALVDELAALVADDAEAAAATSYSRVYSIDDPYSARTDMVVSVYTSVEPAGDAV